ncbi:MAG: glycosyltransferase family 2 protein [Candidatus Omnitrophota bacterium]
MPKLSVIIPVYNEANTIRQIIEKINAVDIDKEIIVVDDGSSDGTGKILRGLRMNNLKVIHHGSNRGKGAAFLTGLSQASGELVVIQDADLEYDPAEYMKLIGPVIEQKADMVLGCRFTKGYHGLLVHRMGNMLLTFLVNILFGARLNDCFTCYKVTRREILNSLHLGAAGFEIEIEIVSKVLRRKLRIAEIPVSYHPRSYSEGKKIRLKDGFWAIANILKYKFS